MRERFGWRLRGAVIVGVAIVAVALTATFASAQTGRPIGPLGPTGGPQPTSLDVSSASGSYGGTTMLTATLTAGGTPVPGKSVEFWLNGQDVGGATTDGSGVAELDNLSLSGIDAGFYPSGVQASFAGDLGYDVSSGSADLDIAKLDQNMVIDTHAPTDATYGDTFTVDALGGGSSSPVTYSSSGSCTNTGADFTMTGSGQCVVYYAQSGDTNYNDAPELTETVNGQKADQAININNGAPTSSQYGDEFTVDATGGGSANPVTYGSSGSCTNNGATFTMTSGIGDCTVTYDQAGNDNYNDAPQLTETVTAQKADQTIAVTTDAPPSAVYGSTFDVEANAPGGAVSYTSGGSCSNIDTQYTMTSGVGLCSVYFDQAGNDNYNPAPQVVETVYAAKADQEITFSLGDHTYGDSDFDPGATASSGLAVSYYASGNCAIVSGYVHLTGAGSCAVTASQDGDNNYNAASPVEADFSIGKASLTVTANDQKKLAGQPYDLGSSAFTTSGLVGSDSVSSVTLTSAGTDAGAGAGDYAIVPGDAVDGPSTDLGANYDITYKNGTLHVLPAGIVAVRGIYVKSRYGVIDTFDSSAGPYGSANHGGGAFVIGNGLLSFNRVVVSGSVQSTQNAVNVKKRATVTGDVTAGTTVEHEGTVGGTVTENSPAAPVVIPEFRGCSEYSAPKGMTGDNFHYSVDAGNLTVKSGNLRLANGTYCFHNIHIAGGATLIVNGPVIIELRGKLTGRGRIANTTLRPANLYIKSSFVGYQGVRVNGGKSAYMTILAPSTGVWIPSGQFFGAVLARTVSITGKTSFHEDTN